MSVEKSTEQGIAHDLNRTAQSLLRLQGRWPTREPGQRARAACEEAAAILMDAAAELQPTARTVSDVRLERVHG